MSTLLNTTFTQPIAYFCAEYALDSTTSTFAGGLGILAGDYLHEAQDQKFPVIAIGLWYAGSSTALHEIVTNELGKPLLLSIPIQDETAYAQVWMHRMGSVTIYFLDTNITQNTIEHQQITQHLYDPNKKTRFQQEMVLGIGGCKVLKALQITPHKYHLNEGHSALLGLELTCQIMLEQDISFEKALTLAKQKIVYTNHTLVAAGHDVYEKSFVEDMLSKFVKEASVPMPELINLGLLPDSSTFSLTELALHMASKVNAVSKLHSRKAAELWPHTPMRPITNGIHIPTWDQVKDIQKHSVQKQLLLDYIQKTTDIKWNNNELLLGWARRFVSYKRPLAILEDVQRFCTLARSAGRPIKLVISGTPPPTDLDGVALLQKLKFLIQESVSDCVVYLPNYSINIAKHMTAGCDVWLNTPQIGLEACGTSGMKAALNGVLPCSTKDGWVDEVNLHECGWDLDTDTVGTSILDTLEHHIVPMYYDEPDEWRNHMQHARDLILSSFSTIRMLNEYIEFMYE